MTRRIASFTLEICWGVTVFVEIEDWLRNKMQVQIFEKVKVICFNFIVNDLGRFQ